MGFDVAFFQLLFRMLAGQTGQISKVDYFPQKPHFTGRPVSQPFERARPETAGISSAYVESFLKEMASCEKGNPHHIMIMRHGKVIAECAYAPYQRGMWHITHSLCKAVTGMAAGIAVGEGLMRTGEQLIDIFPEYASQLDRLLRNSSALESVMRRNVTVRNLLDMTSEVDFSEAGAISGNNWINGFMRSSTKAAPGTKFDYNSMNSYMISAIIQKRSGMPMDEYLQSRLFEPLGIDEVFWERCPQGITKGGWGMFLRPEDAMKLGWLYLRGGRWKGSQIVPRYWVRKSTHSQVDNGRFGYGYYTWMDERPGSFAFNGLFGQNVICYPDLDMVIVLNAGNNELFADGEPTRVQRKYWGIGFHPADQPLPDNDAAYASLQKTISYFEQVPPLLRPARPYSWGPARIEKAPMKPEELTAAIQGSTFEMEKCQIGLFPLVCQVMHNNFTDGIREVGFDSIDGQLMVSFREGSQEHRIRVGFDGPQISEIMLHDEPYYTGVTGKISSDELGRIVLLLEIAFIEEACTRNIKFYFDGVNIEMRADELPGNDVIVDALNYTGDPSGLEKIPFVKSMINSGGRELVDTAVYATVHAVDFGHLKL